MTRCPVCEAPLEMKRKLICRNCGFVDS